MSVNSMRERSTSKKQVAYRLDTYLIDCIDGLQALYPRFSATDIVDLMLKSFVATHDIASHEGEKTLDRAIGQYLRGEFDRTVEELSSEYTRIAQERETQRRED